MYAIRVKVKEVFPQGVAGFEKFEGGVTVKFKVVVRVFVLYRLGFTAQKGGALSVVFLHSKNNLVVTQTLIYFDSIDIGLCLFERKDRVQGG